MGLGLNFGLSLAGGEAMAFGRLGLEANVLEALCEIEHQWLPVVLGALEIEVIHECPNLTPSTGFAGCRKE